MTKSEMFTAMKGMIRERLEAGDLTYYEFTDTLQKGMIEMALEIKDGNRTHAAKLLCMGRANLHMRLRLLKKRPIRTGIKYEGGSR